MRWGYDYYCIDKNDLFELLIFAKSKKLKIYSLQKKDHFYFFYASSFERLQWRFCEVEREYIKTVGFIKYIVCLKSFSSLCTLLGFFLGLCLCMKLIFSVRIIGSLPNLNKDMSMFLKEKQITIYSFKKSYEQLNDLLLDLKEKYKDDVEYLNVYQKGGVFFVEYTKKTRIDEERYDFKNLYALKDGMIESFDIESGQIKVKRLDYVKKGDLLVENQLIDTSDESHIVPVKGKVYAYTFNQYEASIVNHNQDMSSAFYQLLLMIRSKIPVDAFIDKENVLQIEKSSSKITLRMHYTLLENIAIKEN